jgi:hypothetical protein
MKLITMDPDELDPYPAQKQPPYRTDITAAPIADAPASDRFRAQPLPATESSLASAEDPRLAQVRLTRGAPGEWLAGVALVLPFVYAGVTGLGYVTSLELSLALSIGTVGLTAILLSVDAASLRHADRSGGKGIGPGGLLVGMLLLWLIFYPLAYFQRSRFGRANFGWLALLAVVAFIGGPLVVDYFGTGFGAKVQQGAIEVFYTAPVTRGEGERLATHLNKRWQGVGNRASVQLQKSGVAYQFRMVVRKEFQGNPAMLAELDVEGAVISREVLAGAPVEVHVCDEYFKTLSIRPPRAN